VASLTLETLSKRYPNGFAAVDEVSLEITDGELLVLVGPSGSGKSTVLRLIAGLVEPSAGRIFIGSRDVTAAPPQARDVAMVFQSYALYPHKTVRENMAFGLRVRGIDAATIDQRVRAAAVTLDIDALLDRKPAQLSGGQRQRVALGRAIVREPQVFLLDEPLSNLDPLLRVATRAELALLHRRAGVTMVYVTHDQEEAMTLGTRIAVMRDGRVEQVGPPMEVYQRPANSFVARFIGSPAMNLLPATATIAGDRRRLTSPAFTLDVEARFTPEAASTGERLLVGIRPQDLELCAPGEGDGDGLVAVVEPLGPVSLVHLEVEGLPEMVRVLVSADAPIRTAVGDRAGLRIRPERVHLFEDTREGGRLGIGDL
jgi:multiple sugar transport system ATP-binding protein